MSEIGRRLVHGTVPILAQAVITDAIIVIACVLALKSAPLWVFIIVQLGLIAGSTAACLVRLYFAHAAENERRRELTMTSAPCGPPAPPR